VKLKRIRRYWLSQKPPQELGDLSQMKYVLFDATYFGKDHCFICCMNATNQTIISSFYTKNERSDSVRIWLDLLKSKGLCPLFVTLDGETAFFIKIQAVWPKTHIQRCLYHLKRKAFKLLRKKPKLETAIELKELLKTLCGIASHEEKETFLARYDDWLGKYKKTANIASAETPNIKKTIILIHNARPYLFTYLDDPNIHKTNNALEGFFSRLKADYWRHRGLTRKHRKSYLAWYCYHNNKLK